MIQARFMARNVYRPVTSSLKSFHFVLRLRLGCNDRSVRYTHVFYTDGGDTFVRRTDALFRFGCLSVTPARKEMAKSSKVSGSCCPDSTVMSVSVCVYSPPDWHTRHTGGKRRTSVRKSGAQAVGRCARKTAYFFHRG